MKMIMIFLLTGIAFLFGCKGLMNSDKVKPFIPGTYLATWTSSFSNAVDSMTITPVSEHGSEGYLIVRRMHLVFINAAKKRAPEYSISKWQGSYNAADKTIVVPVNGRVLSFDPDNKLLRMGAVTYKKL